VILRSRLASEPAQNRHLYATSVYAYAKILPSGHVAESMITRFARTSNHALIKILYANVRVLAALLVLERTNFLTMFDNYGCFILVWLSYVMFRRPYYPDICPQLDCDQTLPPIPLTQWRNIFKRKFFYLKEKSLHVNCTRLAVPVP
jgi:hypothetical protein